MRWCKALFDLGIATVVYKTPLDDVIACYVEFHIVAFCLQHKSYLHAVKYGKFQDWDKVIPEFKKYPNVPIVAIIEPDSLPNLATNMNFPKCQQGQNAYKQGIEYTLREMAKLDHVTSYLDAAHGGWLGWDNNAQCSW